MTAMIVAEDDRMISLLLCSIVRSEGHQPQPVFDIPTAIEAALAAAPGDLLLLDMHMPGGTAIDLLERLREAGKQLPVILLSGSTDAARLERVRELGVTEQLSKPVTREGLLAAIGRVISPEGAARPV